MSNEYNHIRAEHIHDAPVIQRDGFVVLKGSGTEWVMTPAGARKMAAAMERAAEQCAD